MGLEKETTRLKVIIGGEATAIKLLEKLNKALLVGVEPSAIIEQISLLELAKRMEYKELNS